MSRNNHKQFLGMMLIVLVASVACTSTSQSEITMRNTVISREQIAQGQEIYAQYCASCHGINAEGQFPNVPDQRDATGRLGAPPHDGSGHTWHHGDELLIGYVLNGGLGLSNPEQFYPMPPFNGILTEQQAINVLAYIKTLWNDEQRASQQLITDIEAQQP